MTARIIHHAHQTTAMEICITSIMLTRRSLCNVTNMAAVLYSRVPRALSSVPRCRCASTSDSSENVANCANDSIDDSRPNCGQVELLCCLFVH